MASVEPRTFSFEGLITQVRQGILRVPRFHRSFVWRRDQILELFDSISRRYPVGSLLIWRTRERYSSFERLGPVAISSKEPEGPAEIGYVLDGHQRLSAIFGVFALDEDAAASLQGSDRSFLVYYDLEDDRFAHVRHPKSHHLPVRYLLGHDDELSGWLVERRDAAPPGSAERVKWDRFRRRAVQLQTVFAQYRLPYLDMTDATLEEAVDVFSRVNRRGTVVRQEEVIAALTWTPSGFDVSQAAKDLLEQYPRYRSFGTTPILQAVLAALGERVCDTNWERMLDHPSDRLRDAINVVGEAMGRALAFLGERMGAASSRVVPYGIQIVLLTELFRLRPDPDAATLDELERWVWATSFASAYSSANDALIEDSVDRIRKLARGDEVMLLPERLILRPLPRTFHPKSARVRVFHLFLKSRQPRDLSTGELIEPAKLLLNGMGDARTITSGDERAFQLAGRFLVGPGPRSILRDLEALARMPRPLFVSDDELAHDDDLANLEMILRSHLIPHEALDALLVGGIDAFLDLREREIIEEERAFAAQFVDLPVEEFEEEAEIDVEEVAESDF